jgi:hyaluronoglucosaminidase
MRYSSSEDRAALLEKMAAFRALGSRFLALTLDDIPQTLVHEEDRRAFRSLAEAHVAVTNELATKLGRDVTLWLVPTDYIGVEPTPYLEELGAGLAPGVEVAWTGRTVVSPTIRVAEAARRAATVRRRLLVWDNTPVSDGAMRPMLHLGPYGGRDPGLPAHLSGILLNPMERAHASAITICTAAAYLVEPERYDPERSWEEALREMGEGDPEALRLFAEAHRFHPVCPADRDRELERRLESLRAGIDGGKSCAKRIEELRAQVELRLGCARRLREGLRDQKLRAEIEPWIESHQRETRRIAAALDALKVFLSAAPLMEKSLALLALGRRVNADPAPVAQSYGPRRVVYPQLVSRRDGSVGLGADPAVFRDLCLADAFVSLAEDVAVARLAP